MSENLDKKITDLVKKITSVSSKEDIDNLERFLMFLYENDAKSFSFYLKIVANLDRGKRYIPDSKEIDYVNDVPVSEYKSLKKDISVEDLINEENHEFDRKGFEELINELCIEEPLEDLISAI